MISMWRPSISLTIIRPSNFHASLNSRCTIEIGCRRGRSIDGKFARAACPAIAAELCFCNLDAPPTPCPTPMPSGGRVPSLFNCLSLVVKVLRSASAATREGKMWKLKLSQGQEPWLTSVNNHVGRQYWEYGSSLGTPEEIARVHEIRHEYHKNRFQSKHSSDRIMRLQFERSNQSEVNLLVEEEEDEVKRALIKALRFYSTLQADDGFWPGDYAGPLFLIPGLIIGLYVTRSLSEVLSMEHQKEILRYLYNHQNEDGGWGLHIEGHSTMFGTALTYVTLRLLGQGLNDEMLKTQKWILERGGVVSIPSWGKLWLSVLGLYEWSGNNPVPPELWLLPYALPFHPGRMWSHVRVVYLPMSYLYAKRFIMPINNLILSMRNELFVTPYSNIDWDSARNSCAKEDLYYPRPAIQDILWAGLHKIGEPILKQWPFYKIRQRALNEVKKHMQHEDETTNSICSGPVNKVLNMVCCWIDDPNSQAFTRLLEEILG
uniref:Squalene cyclase N-terminal domain-containing protein n=2 Tax=Kalanchoe fedtschenkoi TaxID=63787 RepID=A0A7N0V7W6_KALFE